MRVLVAEDDAALGRQVAEHLRRAGYAVDWERDGEEAHFLGDTEPYDAVVLDLGLPHLDGLTALRRWRAVANTARASRPARLARARRGSANSWRRRSHKTAPIHSANGASGQVHSSALLYNRAPIGLSVPGESFMNTMSCPSGVSVAVAACCAGTVSVGPATRAAPGCTRSTMGAGVRVRYVRAIGSK